MGKRKADCTAEEWVKYLENHKLKAKKKASYTQEEWREVLAKERSRKRGKQRKKSAYALSPEGKRYIRSRDRAARLKKGTIKSELSCRDAVRALHRTEKKENIVVKLLRDGPVLSGELERKLGFGAGVRTSTCRRLGVCNKGRAKLAVSYLIASTSICFACECGHWFYVCPETYQSKTKPIQCEKCEHLFADFEEMAEVE